LHPRVLRQVRKILGPFARMGEIKEGVDAGIDQALHTNATVTPNANAFARVLARQQPTRHDPLAVLQRTIHGWSVA
jgi:hypothetical protein